MNLVAISLSLFTLALLVLLIFQMRNQRRATEELLADNRVRTRLYQDADESTTLILSRTIQNISAGHPDPNLESDSFTLKVVRELVKRRVPKDKCINGYHIKLWSQSAKFGMLRGPGSPHSLVEPTQQ